MPTRHEPRGRLATCLKDSVRVAGGHRTAGVRERQRRTMPPWPPSHARSGLPRGRAASPSRRTSSSPRSSVPDPGDGEIARPQRVRLGRPVHARADERREVVRAAVRARRAAHGRRRRPGRRVSERPLAEGAWVLHDLGWREMAVSDGRGVAPVDPARAPISTALGVLGMPGLTAFVGIVDIGEVRRGETVFVSGAAGAVGSVAAQLARIRGARVIGSAGLAGEGRLARGARSRRRLRLRATATKDGLREHAPDGIDVYFDNVGGETLEAAIGALRLHGRVVACGAISRYNATERRAGPAEPLPARDEAAADAGVHRLRPPRADRGVPRRGGAARRRRDDPLPRDVVDGIDRAPEAFIGLLSGANIGKMLVRVGPEP